MTGMRMLLAAALVGAVGCHNLQRVEQPSQFIPQASPNLVYVTYHDNSIVPVEKPKVRGDSLFGTWQGLGEPIAVPLNHLQTVEAVLPNKQRTTLAVVGLTLATAAGVYAVAQLASGTEVCDYTRHPEFPPGGDCVGRGDDG